MSNARENLHIARLIVGAMSIDGMLDKTEREKVARALNALGMSQLIAYVGSAIEDDSGSFNMFEECRELVDLLGSNAVEMSPVIFRVITEVVASDRFVSMQEASYLSALSRRLEIAPTEARAIFREVMAERRSRLEASASSVDEQLHPHLKSLLNFSGSEDLVGKLAEDSFEEMLASANQGASVSHDEVARAVTILGLKSNAKLADAEEVWRETIDSLNLPKMAQLGETFVSAAINRITQINEAYKTILHFHEASGEHKQAVGE